MHHMKRYLPSPALLVAAIALFVALGGPAAAQDAVSAAVAKIKGKQVAKNAIKSRHIANGTLRLKDFKASQRELLKGEQGDAGPAGATGSTGPAGPAGPLLDVLPSGRTLRGSYALLDRAAADNDGFGAGVPFAFAMPAELTAHYIDNGAAPPAQCPGTLTAPEAAPGHLCVYEQNSFAVGNQKVLNPVTNVQNVSSKWGFTVFMQSTGATATVEVRGTWAATAP